MFSVGIADFTCPVRIPEKSGGIQQTVASIGLWAELEAACPGAPAETPTAFSKISKNLILTMRKEKKKRLVRRT